MHIENYYLRDCSTAFSLKAIYRCVSVFICFLGFLTLSSNAFSADLQEKAIDVPSLQASLEGFQNSNELILEIERITQSLSPNATKSDRIELDLWKLKVLNNISDTQRTADFGKYIYQNYERSDYVSEKQFGETMQQIVQAVSKTQDLGLSFEIVKNLRESAYNEPSTYLDFIIDKSLMEIYIETFDYDRALEVELYIINNAEYASLDALKQWRPRLHVEIAFLYNRLGDGAKALEHLEYSRREYESLSLSSGMSYKETRLNKGNQARAHLLLGNYSISKDLGREILEHGKETDQNYVTALGYRLIGASAYRLGQYDEAETMLSAGIKLSDDHGISTMKKHLYNDYALLLEAQGHFERALIWERKHSALDRKAAKSAAAARLALNQAEANASEGYRELLALRHENESQREISQKNNYIKGLLLAVVVSLAMLAGILTHFVSDARKTQKKLALSEDKAQKANKAKSEFLANMSHEIRTPMNGVLGMLQLLQRTELNEQQKFYADIMKGSGDSLVTVISDILDFSKIEDNKLTFNSEVANLEDTLGSVTNLFYAKAKEKSLEIKFSYDPSLPKYYEFDVTRIRQIISNLIGNAIKFTESGMVHVSITGFVEQGVADLQIDIQDTGMGISPEKIALVFEKFTQANGDITSKFGGSGLGLAISKKLAEAMGGSLALTSELGVGSKFSVRLPLKISSYAASQSNLSKRIGGAPPLRLPQGSNISEAQTRFLSRTG